MLKLRLQGTKKDIRWFLKLLNRIKQIKIERISKFFDNYGTDKYKRVYVDISRSSGKSNNEDSVKDNN